MAKKLVIRGGQKLLGSLDSGVGDPILTRDVTTKDVGTVPAIDASTYLSTSLNSGQLFVGNASNLAQARTITGAVLFSNTGLTSIATDVITNANIFSGAGITYGKLNLANSIVNNDIAVAANIARTKLASGNVNRILINNGSGIFSEQAAITANRLLISDINGLPIASSITDVVASYLNPSSPLQEQLNNRLTFNSTIIPAEGDLVVYQSGVWNRFAKGTSGQYLTSTVGGLAWASTPNGLPTGGTTNQYLKKNSGTDFDTSWDTLSISDITDITASPAQINVLATGFYDATSSIQTQLGSKLGTGLPVGNIWYGNASGIATPLAIGASGQVLTVAGGLPVWQTITGTGTVTAISGSGGTTGLTLTPGVGSPITTSGTLTLGGILNAVNGGTGINTYTTGDILYASATNTLSKLAAGTNTYVLTMTGGVPVWAAPTSLPFADNVALLKNNADNTKQAKFDLSGLTTATTRTFTMPDFSGNVLIDAATQTNSGVKTFLDGTFGMRNVANTFTSTFTNTNTSAQTYTWPNFTGNVLVSGGNNIYGSTTFTGATNLFSGSGIGLVVNTGGVNFGSATATFAQSGSDLIATTSSAQGIKYPSDYSSGFVSNSLISKTYADNRLAGLTFTNSPSTNNVPTFNGTNWTFQTPSGGTSTFFTSLTDVPSSYTSQAKKGVRVNGTPNGLEFYTITPNRTLTVSGSIAQTDENGVVVFNSATPINFTVNQLTQGTIVNLLNKGAGDVTLVAGSGVTITGATLLTGGGNYSGVIYFDTQTNPIITTNVGGGGSGWALTGTSTLTGATTIAGSTSNTIKFKFDNLGVTSTDGAGLWLQNSQAATSGNQQISPSLIFEGQGYETGTPLSRSIRLKQYLLPVQQSISAAGGVFNTDVSIDGGTTYNRLLSTNVNTGKTIIKGNVNYDNPPFFEFVRNQGGVEVGRGSVGYLGSTEMNLSVNMDYTLGSHRYYDASKNAIWMYMSNVANGFGIQWTKSGNPNDATMWTTYGRVPFSVDVIPSTAAITNANTQGLGQAVRGGSKVTLQQIAMIDDNYTSSDALIKLSSQIMSITGPASVSVPKISVGSATIPSTEIAAYQNTGANTYLTFTNQDNNSNYNQYRFIKNKSGSYNLGAGTKIIEFEHNTVANNGSRATSTVNGGFSNVEFYWNTTNTAGVTGDRFIIGQDGQIGVGGANYGTSGQVLTSQGSGSAPIWSTTSAGGVTSVNVTSSQTLTTAANTIYNVFVDATAGNIVITLPTASATTEHRIKRIDSTSNTVTFTGTIDGDTSYLGTTGLLPLNSFTLISNGTNFYAI